MQGDATFSLFVRRLPPQRGFLVAAGLEPRLEFLESFAFRDDDLEYLGEAGIRGRGSSQLGDCGSTATWAVPEGRIVHANEPLLEITAPIAVAQLVEPLLLNQITFQTTIASKAARCVIAAGGRDVVDFSLRRTPGARRRDGGRAVTAMVGFAATSNVEAARRYGLRSERDDGALLRRVVPEREARRSGRSRATSRTRTTFLVDTYDTLNGVGRRSR